MAHPHRADAKAMAAKKLASYGGESTGLASSKPFYGSDVLDGSEKVSDSDRTARACGGKVEGDKPKMRLDRAPRKKGGRVCKSLGGDLDDDKAVDTGDYAGGYDDPGASGRRVGPSIKGEMGPDQPKLSQGFRYNVDEPNKWLGKKNGGKICKAAGGKVAENSAADKAMDKKSGEDTKDDKKHDRAERASGGKIGKGKTTVNIVIGSPQGQQDASAPQPPAPPMQQAPSAPPPSIPPQALAAMAAMHGGPGMPPGGMPMPRQRGGRVKLDAGSGGAKGRLEKIKL